MAQYLTYKCKVKRISYEPFVETMMMAATKVWNTSIYWSRKMWDETGVIPSEYNLAKIVRRNTEWYSYLPADVADAVVKEVAGSYRSWFALRRNKTVNNPRPPSFRRKTEPSVLTYRDKIVWHMPEWGNVLKLTLSRKVSDRSAFVYVEFDARDGVDFSNIKTVKLAKKNGTYELLVTVAVETKRAVGTEYAAIDLGVNNIATIAFSNGDSAIIPANWLSAQDYYFRKEIAKCRVKSKRYFALWSKLRGRRNLFTHAMTKRIIEECEKRNVGTLFVGYLTGIRKDKDFGDKGNQKIHGWNFAQISEQLTYKGNLRGVTVNKVKENYTSQTCAKCGTCDKSNRVKRGLYVCKSCDYVQNADVNGAINILRKGISESAATDKSIGCETHPELWRWDEVINSFTSYGSNR